MGRPGINGSVKGKVAEREVARLITPWWWKVEPGSEFIRTPQSGGWATPELRCEFKASGDLMTTAARFPFTVEVKRREDWRMSSLEKAKQCQVWTWWIQTQRAANEERREPMLWFRRNRDPWRVMLRYDYVASIKGMPSPDVVWSAAALQHLHYGDAVPVVYIYDRFFAVSPKKFLVESS